MWRMERERERERESMRGMERDGGNWCAKSFISAIAAIPK